MTRTPRNVRTDRRNFLLATGGVLAAAASAGDVAQAAPVAAPKAPDKPRNGYRVTAHVTKYYDKART
jgi:hypothetical protein